MKRFISSHIFKAAAFLEPIRKFFMETLCFVEAFSLYRYLRPFESLGLRKKRIDVQSLCKRIGDKVDREVLEEYGQLNEGEEGDLFAQRNKMIYIQAFLSRERPDLVAQYLGLSLEETALCDHLGRIAGEVYRLRGFFPRANQILSVLLFVDGKSTVLAQIQTGQGKTLIAAMTAILRILMYRERVFIVTTTEPLASSGVVEMRNLYETFGVRAVYFNAQGFEEDLCQEVKDYDVIYATSYALQCDKLAGKEFSVFLSSKLGIWDSPYRKLEKMMDLLKKRGERMDDFTTLLTNYRRAPTEGKREEIRKRIRILKEDYRDLFREDPDICFLVDEADFVLYDHIGEQVAMASPMPCSWKIWEIGLDIAKRTESFFSSPGIKRPLKFKEETKTEIMRILRESEGLKRSEEFDIYFFDYIEGELDRWMENALSVFDPKSERWRDGVIYLKAPSVRYELENIFIQFKEIVQEAGGLKKIYDRGKEAIRKLDAESFIDRMTIFLGEMSEIPACAKYLVDYMPDLAKEVVQLTDPKYEAFKSAVFHLNCRLRRMSETGRENMFQNHIRYIDQDTAQVVDQMKFGDLIHLFLEYKEYKEEISQWQLFINPADPMGLILDCPKQITGTFPTSRLGVQSQLDCMRSADCIIGITGTLPDASVNRREYEHFHKLSKRNYQRNTKSIAERKIPNFVKSRKIDKGRVICQNREEWETCVRDEVFKRREEEQAVLIVCRNPREACKIDAFLRLEGVVPKGVYMRREDKETLDVSYQAGDVVITTALGSRGTDWHVEAPRGFHVLCTSRPRDFRMKMQISGRSARNGQEGSYGEIIFQKEEEEDFELGMIDKNLRESCYDDLSSVFYEMFINIILEDEWRKPEGSKDANKVSRLTLWMSKSQMKEKMSLAIEEELSSSKDMDSKGRGLEQIFVAFCERFDFSSEEKVDLRDSLEEEFWFMVREWKDQTLGSLC